MNQYDDNRSVLRVSTQTMRLNLKKVVKQVNEKTLIMAVIKADGYGLGIKSCVMAFDKEVDYYGVATVEEALKIRENKSNLPILVLGYIPLNLIMRCLDNNIYPTIISLDYARKLNNLAEQLGIKINCHLKLDTGFHRIGINVDDVYFKEKAKELSTFGSLNMFGVFTHFSSAGSTKVEDILFTRNQYNKFMDSVDFLEESGFKFAIKHCCNSRATLYNPEYHLDMVRIGMHLYGLGPEQDISLLKLKQVMKWEAKIVTVKEVKKGEFIGYSRDYRASKDMKIAIIASGFGDGYFRSLYTSDEPLIIVNGNKTKIIGKICMDYLMIDVTYIKNVESLTYVTLLGSNQESEIYASALGKLVGGTAVEITTHIGKRVKRIIDEK